MLNVMHHCCQVFLLGNSLHLDVNEIISFQKLVGNLDKITVASLRRQHQGDRWTPISRVLENICICLKKSSLGL